MRADIVVKTNLTIDELVDVLGESWIPSDECTKLTLKNKAFDTLGNVIELQLGYIESLYNPHTGVFGIVGKRTMGSYTFRLFGETEGIVRKAAELLLKDMCFGLTRIRRKRAAASGTGKPTFFCDQICIVKRDKTITIGEVRRRRLLYDHDTEKLRSDILFAFASGCIAICLMFVSLLLTTSRSEVTSYVIRLFLLDTTTFQTYIDRVTTGALMIFLFGLLKASIRWIQEDDVHIVWRPVGRSAE